MEIECARQPLITAPAARPSDLALVEPDVTGFTFYLTVFVSVFILPYNSMFWQSVTEAFTNPVCVSRVSHFERTTYFMIRHSSCGIFSK